MHICFLEIELYCGFNKWFWVLINSNSLAFHLQAADEGEYQCVAESEAGRAERTIALKVQSKSDTLYIEDTCFYTTAVGLNYLLHKAQEQTLVLFNNLVSSVNGGYSNWEEWGPCSSTCGQGFQKRIRLCNSPEPTNGGRSCSGPSTDSRKCQAGLCPGMSPFVLVCLL